MQDLPTVIAGEVTAGRAQLGMVLWLRAVGGDCWVWFRLEPADRFGAGGGAVVGTNCGASSRRGSGPGCWVGFWLGLARCRAGDVSSGGAYCGIRSRCGSRPGRGYGGLLPQARRVG